MNSNYRIGDKKIFSFVFCPLFCVSANANEAVDLSGKWNAATNAVNHPPPTLTKAQTTKIKKPKKKLDDGKATRA